MTRARQRSAASPAAASARPPGGPPARARRWRPRSHWLLFALAFLTLTATLLFGGYASNAVGVSSAPVPRPDEPGLHDVAPVLDFSSTAVRSAGPADHEVALTFDDGPDSTWTPLVLDVLRQERVPATFFVVGSKVLAHPELVRQVQREGHELGSHTFTHVHLDTVPRWRARLELTLTQTALAGTVGRKTALLRPPYTSGPDSLGPPEERAAREASRFGYLIALADRNTQDWSRPGVERIVVNALPAEGRGAVVLLHDGGGDRSQTVAAVSQLISTLKAQGYRFVRLSDVGGVPAGAASVEVSGLEHLRGLALLSALRLADAVTAAVSWLLVPVGALSVLRCLVVVVLARRQARRSRAMERHPFAPAVSVVVPAYNEEVGIEAALRSLLASRYRDFEVVVVDDGSTDRTAEIAAGIGDPRLVLVRQANAGKPAAINTGLRRARHEIVVMVDGDTVFEPDALWYLVQPLADPGVGAVSGNTKVGNRSGLLGRWQHIEYVLGFNLDRRMYDELQCMPTVPGAIGAFRRAALEAAGGVSDDTLAEDTDLTMAVNRAGWRVVYEERARAWTEAPASLTALWGQRCRWSYGTMQAMWKHRSARREGTGLGRWGIPYLFVFQIAFPLLAPVIDLWALYGLVFLDPVSVVAFWVGFNVLQMAVGLYAFRLDGERPGPLWATPLQQLVYRQLMYLVVIQSVVSAVLGSRLRWHKLARTGIDLPA